MKILSLLTFAAGLFSQTPTNVKPPQLGLPPGEGAVQLVAHVNGEFKSVEIGAGVELVTTSSGKMILRGTVQSTPAAPPPQELQQFRLNRLPNGNWPGCKGMIFQNRTLVDASHFSITASGEMAASWLATDTVICVTIGTVAAMSLPK